MSTTTLTTTATFKLLSKLIASDVLGVPAHTALMDLDLSLLDGHGQDKANRRYVSAARSLAAGASETFDLSDGSMLDVFGNQIVFASVKLIVVQLIEETANYRLEVGGAASQAWAGTGGFLKDVTDIASARAGGFILGYAPDAFGYPVDAASAHNLKIRNPNATGITYNLLIVGGSTAS